VFESVDHGILHANVSAAIRRVKGVRQIGQRVGNWLTVEQGQELQAAISPKDLRGKQADAILSPLLAVVFDAQK
jgi:hypothetical protein